MKFLHFLHSQTLRRHAMEVEVFTGKSFFSSQWSLSKSFFTYKTITIRRISFYYVMGQWWRQQLNAPKMWANPSILVFMFNIYCVLIHLLISCMPWIHLYSENILTHFSIFQKISLFVHFNCFDILKKPCFQGDRLFE